MHFYSFILQIEINKLSMSRMLLLISGKINREAFLFFSLMMRDERYRQLKELFERRNYFTTFSEIFKVVPKSVVLLDIKVNDRRISKMIANPGGISIDEIEAMAAVMEIDFMILLDLIRKEAKSKRSVKTGL